MIQKCHFAIRMCAVGALLVAGAPLARISQAGPGSLTGGRAVAIPPATHTVTISASATSLGVDPDPLQAYNGESVAFSASGGSYTVEFPDGDPFGWGGAPQSVPVTGTVTATPAAGGELHYKYTVRCVSGCRPDVPALDPHVIIMGK